MPGLSIHVVDVSRGVVAAGMGVEVFAIAGDITVFCGPAPHASARPTHPATIHAPRVLMRPTRSNLRTSRAAESPTYRYE